MLTFYPKLWPLRSMWRKMGSRDCNPKLKPSSDFRPNKTNFSCYETLILSGQEIASIMFMIVGVHLRALASQNALVSSDNCIKALWNGYPHLHMTSWVLIFSTQSKWLCQFHGGEKSKSTGCIIWFVKIVIWKTNSSDNIITVFWTVFLQFKHIYSHFMSLPTSRVYSTLLCTSSSSRWLQSSSVSMKMNFADMLNWMDQVVCQLSCCSIMILKCSLSSLLQSRTLTSKIWR